MLVKYHINRLETILKRKYYCSRRKKLAHLALDKSIDQYQNYVGFLKEIESFFYRHFKDEFDLCNQIKIVNTIKCKFDYVIFRKHSSD